MNLLNWNDHDRTALRNFYEADGSWTWEDLENGRGAVCRAVRDWIEASEPPRANPLLLPRVQGTGSAAHPIWYAVAFSEAQAEALREDLIAFVGPAGSDFTGLHADLAAVDLAESCLALWAGGPWIYRLSVLPQCRDIVRGALERLRRSWRMRPSLAGTTFRTTEALLREFSSALVNGDEASALRWWGELRAGGRLSAENLVFLDIERLAAFGRWQDLAALPQLSLLMPGRRPHRITMLIVEALWRTEMADFAHRNDASGAIQYFRSQFGPRYQALLRARGNSSGAPIALTFLLAAVASEPPRREQIPALMELLADSPEYAFATSIAAHLPAVLASVSRTTTEVEHSPLEMGRAAFTRDDYDTAWQYLREVDPASVDSCSLMLECADELQLPEVARVVSERFGTLKAEEQKKVLSTHRRRRAWEEIQKLLAPTRSTPPTDWEEWLVCLDATPQWSQLLPIAQQASSDWPNHTYLQNPARVRLLAERLIKDRTGPTQDALRFAFPHLLAFFLPSGQGHGAFLPVYSHLLLILGTGDRFSAEDWTTAQTLLMAILEAGAGPEVYAETLDALQEIWRKFGSATRLDWALDTLDFLAAANASVPNSRGRYFDAVRESFTREYRRVRTEQWKVFEWLAQDLGRAGEIESLSPRTSQPNQADGRDNEHPLMKKVVGIYTLTESAGARAKSILEVLYPGADVRLNHEHGGSERLRSLAREADYFIVATQSATHAATGFLKNKRPNEKSALIYPTGKGSSSIVSALRNALEAEASKAV